MGSSRVAFASAVVMEGGWVTIVIWVKLLREHEGVVIAKGLQSGTQLPGATCQLVRWQHRDPSSPSSRVKRQVFLPSILLSTCVDSVNTDRPGAAVVDHGASDGSSWNWSCNRSQRRSHDGSHNRSDSRRDNRRASINRSDQGNKWSLDSSQTRGRRGLQRGSASVVASWKRSVW